MLIFLWWCCICYSYKPTSSLLTYTYILTIKHIVEYQSLSCKCMENQTIWKTVCTLYVLYVCVTCNLIRTAASTVSCPFSKLQYVQCENLSSRVAYCRKWYCIYKQVWLNANYSMQVKQMPWQGLQRWSVTWRAAMSESNGLFHLADVQTKCAVCIVPVAPCWVCTVLTHGFKAQLQCNQVSQKSMSNDFS